MVCICKQDCQWRYASLSPPSILRRPSGTDNTLPTSVPFFHLLNGPMTWRERTVSQTKAYFYCNYYFSLFFFLLYFAPSDQIYCTDPSKSKNQLMLASQYYLKISAKRRLQHTLSIKNNKQPNMYVRMYIFVIIIAKLFSYIIINSN